MSKYIPAEKLIAEIERLKGQLIRGACAAQVAMETNCKDEAYNEILALITSIKREQHPLPSNLDETAEEILSKKYPLLHNGSFLMEREMMELIKAGAEWMAGQGVSIEYVRKEVVTQIVREYLENWLDSYRIERLIDKIEEL